MPRVSYHSIADLRARAERDGTTLSRVALRDQAATLERSEEELYWRMAERLSVMRGALREGLRPDIRSASGLSGGDGYRMFRRVLEGASLGGGFAGRAAAYALAISEANAGMGRIVAAPTAGSCGVLPGAVLALLDERKLEEQAAVMGLFVAGAIGMVIANEATISGAEGGCQAECGSAAGMAAAALTEMLGGTPEMVGDACAMALKNMLGLVCDPVAGLVEVPCVKRNAGAAAVAAVAADMALAGVKSAIPVDEVIGAMREVGGALPSDLRETGRGGLAATPTGEAIRRRVLGDIEPTRAPEAFDRLFNR